MMTNRYLKVGVLACACLLAISVKAQLSQNPDKFLGNITTEFQVDYGNEAFHTLWNQITPENESKWSTVQGWSRNSWNWGGVDNCVNYAKNHNFPFKYHTLVWGSQFPSWVKDLSAAERYSAIVTWIDAVKARYPNLEIIDVVNEAVVDHQKDTHYISEALGGSGVTGYDWIIKAFEMAYERWPNAILIYNDFNTFQWDTDKYIDLVRTLCDVGAPIDAYGCQSHDMLTLQGTRFTGFRQSMDKLQNALKMPMYITEYDVGTEDDNLQLECYQDQIPYMWEADYCAGVTLWGYIYGKTWTTKGNSGIIRDGEDRPAMTWLRNYMQSTKAKEAKSPFPGMKKEASVYVKPSSWTLPVDKASAIDVRASLRTKIISSVELYMDNVLVSTMTKAPYTANVTPKTAGRHELRAVVIATDGSRFERLGGFTAIKERGPYKGEIAIPGTLEAEDFDTGSEGDAFHDSDSENEGTTDYRTDGGGIDIVNGNGGYALGYTAGGEWMEYTVNVAKSGRYTYEAHASSGLTGSGFSVSLVENGQQTTLCQVNVPQTGDNNWNTYTKLEGELSQPLEAGRQVLRITITGGYCNIDKVVFKEVKELEPVVIRANNLSRTYGETNPTLTYTVEGGPMEGTPSLSCQATQSSAVDNYDIVVAAGTVKNPTTLVNGTLAVTKATLTVKANTYTKKQGEENPEFTLTYEGFKNSETASVLKQKPTATTSATKESAPGDYVVTVSGGEAQNYAFTYVNGTLKIGPADPVEVTARSYTREYGQENPTFEYDVVGAKLVGVPAITCEATAATSAGTYPIVITKGDVKNYNDSYVNGTLTITKAPLTVSCGDYTRDEGEENPEFTLTYEGFLLEDTEEDLTVKPTATTEATRDSLAGEYPIMIAGGESTNYTFSYIPGTLTVVMVDNGVRTVAQGDAERFDVYSLSGQLVRRQTTSTRGLPHGIYIVRRPNGSLLLRL